MEEKRIEFGVPLGFSASKWWGYALSTMFILYGGFRILFAVLDRDAQTHTGQPVTLLEPLLLLGIGVLLAMTVYEFGQGKRWGWLSLLAVNSATVLLAGGQLLGFGSVTDAASRPYDAALLVIGFLAIGALLLPSTQRLFSAARR